MALITPYGVAIHDAIASGDVGQMQKTAADAESYLKEYGEIGDGLKKLKAEIQRIGSPTGGVIPMYAPAMRAAMDSGDAGKMKEVAQQAEDWLKQADEVRSAYDELKKAIG